MKKKIAIISCCICIILTAITVALLYNEKKEALYVSKSYSFNNDGKLAIMLQTDISSYEESNSLYFPTSGYTFNSNKSYCKYGGSITYNTTTSKIEVKSTGKEKCFAYFDQTNPSFDNFAYTLLSNNGGVATIEAKAAPNFSNGSPGYSSFELYEYDGETNTSNVSGTAYYFCGTPQINEATGLISFDNQPNTCMAAYSSGYSNMVGKYIPSLTPTSSMQYSDAGGYKYLDTIYYVVSATSSSFTYKIIKTRVSSSSTVLTNDSGMYAAQDNYGTSYYFRGNVNNYFKFTSNSSDLWRVIRINGDGTVRIIRATDIGSAVGYSQGGAQYVGYMYNNSQLPINSIKYSLDTWYTNNLSSAYDSYISKTTMFCNDRNARSSKELQFSNEWNPNGTANAWYEGFFRASNYSPSLYCSSTSDRFNVINMGISNAKQQGNALLTRPIGLITNDELIMAGYTANYYHSSMAPNYLYMNGTRYWTMTPAYNIIQARVFTSTGITSVFDSSTYVFPVVNLIKGVKVTGTGTLADPYIIDTNSGNSGGGNDPTYYYWNNDYEDHVYSTGNYPSNHYTSPSDLDYVFARTTISSGVHEVCLQDDDSHMICLNTSNWNTNASTTRTDMMSALSTAGFTGYSCNTSSNEVDCHLSNTSYYFEISSTYVYIYDDNESVECDIDGTTAECYEQ